MKLATLRKSKAELTKLIFKLYKIHRCFCFAFSLTEPRFSFKVELNGSTSDFKRNRYLKKLQKAKSQPIPSAASPTTVPTTVISPPPLFSSPVDKVYLDQVKLTQLDFGLNDFGFSLPEGSLIYAGFEGSITVSGDDLQRVIILDSSDAQGRLIYIFSGLAEVSDMEKVSQGEVLGRVGKNPLPTREINLIVSYFRDGEKVSLDQEVIKAVKNLP